MQRLTLNLLKAITIVFIVFGFYIPIILFISGNNPLFPEKFFFDFSFFSSFISDSWNQKVIFFTFYQSFLSAILSIIFGFPGAWLVTHFDFPAKRWFRLLTYLPFILPSILVVLAMVQFFGNNGWINRMLILLFGFDEPPIYFLYSFSGILIAHVFYNFPIAMKIIADQWEKISYKYSDGARSLGVGNIRFFFCITLPLILPSLGSSFIIIFLLCMNSFAIILVLGGGIRYTTIEVLIYQLARIELDYFGAANLAFLQCGLSLICITILILCSQNNIEQNISKKYCLLSGVRNFCPKAWFGFFWIFIVLIFTLGPISSIVLDSFRKFENGEWVYTIYWYKKIFEIRDNNFFPFALWNSFRIGFGSAILSSFLGLSLAILIVNKKGIYRHFWELFSFFPIVLSSIVFGVAWFHFYQRNLSDVFPKIYIVIVMHAILLCPFWIRMVLPSLESIPFKWHLESIMLGKNSFQYGLNILWPWLKKTFIISFFFSFSLSLGELNSIMMISDEEVVTIPLEIYNAISGYQFSYASVMAVVLLLLSLSTFLLIELSLEFLKLFK